MLREVSSKTYIPIRNITPMKEGSRKPKIKMDFIQELEIRSDSRVSTPI